MTPTDNRRPLQNVTLAAAMIGAFVIFVAACGSSDSSSEGVTTTVEAPPQTRPVDDPTTPGLATPGPATTPTAPAVSIQTPAGVSIPGFNAGENDDAAACADGDLGACSALDFPALLQDPASADFIADQCDAGVAPYCDIQDNYASSLAWPASVASSLGTEPLALRSMGPLLIGMTLDEAAVAGIDITVDDSDAFPEGCRYGSVTGDPQSPRLMIVDDLDGLRDNTIVRIELVEGSNTLSGIEIGSTKEQVIATYGDQIVVSPHNYTFEDGGEYLTFVPNDTSDANYRLIMETFDDEVTQIRAGLLPAVEWVEGCF